MGGGCLYMKSHSGSSGSGGLGENIRQKWNDRLCLNLEIFEWDAPDQDETPPKNSDVGGTHLGLQVQDIETAVERLADRDDVTVLDEPQTNEDGPTAGLTYVYCRVEWGLYLELLEAPDEMPYADESEEQLYGPAPS